MNLYLSVVCTCYKLTHTKQIPQLQYRVVGLNNIISWMDNTWLFSFLGRYQTLEVLCISNRLLSSISDLRSALVKAPLRDAVSWLRKGDVQPQRQYVIQRTGKVEPTQSWCSLDTLNYAVHATGMIFAMTEVLGRRYCCSGCCWCYHHRFSIILSGGLGQLLRSKSSRSRGGLYYETLQFYAFKEHSTCTHRRRIKPNVKLVNTKIMGRIAYLCQ